jgi:hypothetical protein
MKTYWGVKEQLHLPLTSELDGGEWTASRPGHFTLGKTAPGTHWTRSRDPKSRTVLKCTKIIAH